MLITAPFDLAAVARGRRAELKLGQADVARHIGVGRQWVGKFESGDGTVELAAVLKLVKALGLEVRVVWPRAAPEWTKPLTEAAGSRERPYGKARRPRRRMAMGEG